MRPAPRQNVLASVIRLLAADRNPACLLDTQGKFMFANEAWDQHAHANGGAPGCLGETLIGTSWLGHIHGDEVRRIHGELFERALQSGGAPARPVILVGESNTPTIAALVSTRLDPVLQGGDPIAVRIVYSRVRERPIGEVYDVVDQPPEAYQDGTGGTVQCSCCRRVRDPVEPDRWDFVPALLASPVQATQSICDLCSELHFGCIPEIG